MNTVGGHTPIISVWREEERVAMPPRETQALLYHLVAELHFRSGGKYRGVFNKQWESVHRTIASTVHKNMSGLSCAAQGSAKIDAVCAKFEKFVFRFVKDTETSKIPAGAIWACCVRGAREAEAWDKGPGDCHPGHEDGGAQCTCSMQRDAKDITIQAFGIYEMVPRMD